MKQKRFIFSRELFLPINIYTHIEYRASQSINDSEKRSKGRGSRNLWREFPEGIFEAVFIKVMFMCIDKGMVSGHTQAIDSAPIKANVSMDSLELKVPKEDLESHLKSIHHMSSMDKEEKPLRKSKTNKASKEEQQITANAQELKAIQTRNKTWAKDQDQRPGPRNKGST